MLFEYHHDAAVDRCQRTSDMYANMITLFRVGLVFGVVALLETASPTLTAAATVLVLFVISLDAIDGIVARRFGMESDFGALFDIVGDRIVEMVFWIYFAAIGSVPFWLPMIVVTRAFLSDGVRSAAYRDGQTPFGRKTMMRSPLTRFIVASRFMRGLYGLLKVVLFVYLAGLVWLDRSIAHAGRSVDVATVERLALIGVWLAVATTFLCVVRGAPVLWDGRDILLQRDHPLDGRA
jgi:CDP-diacylglycerol--glycerol-3-phosphate 3-phosphatidyltransferase